VTFNEKAHHVALGHDQILNHPPCLCASVSW
jgi:hypothetical protein